MGKYDEPNMPQTPNITNAEHIQSMHGAGPKVHKHMSVGSSGIHNQQHEQAHVQNGKTHSNQGKQKKKGSGSGEASGDHGSGGSKGKEDLRVECFLLRVRRRRDEEPLEEVELEYDMTCGALKRQKLVTETEALVNNFNYSVSLESRADRETQQYEQQTDV